MKEFVKRREETQGSVNLKQYEAAKEDGPIINVITREGEGRVLTGYNCFQDNLHSGVYFNGCEMKLFDRRLNKGHKVEYCEKLSVKYALKQLKHCSEVNITNASSRDYKELKKFSSKVGMLADGTVDLFYNMK